MRPEDASDMYRELSATMTGKITAMEPLSKHTYFKIGGPAALFAEPNSSADLSLILTSIRKYKAKYYIIGNGTNLLCADEGYDGVIVKIGSDFAYCQAAGDLIEAGAGILLSVLANRAMELSLEGLEFASGIPGYLGGALCMNAGAYGGEMKAIVESVSYIDLDGSENTVDAEHVKFGYRSTIFTDAGKIVTKARLRLKKGEQSAIREHMNKLNAQRLAKQPLNMPSAGSTFKRPATGYASKLIEDAGLKGLVYRGAMVSDKHGGFIVNRGDATCEDVLELMRIVINTVMDKFGIQLEPEVKIIGTSL